MDRTNGDVLAVLDWSVDTEKGDVGEIKLGLAWVPAPGKEVPNYATARTLFNKHYNNALLPKDKK